MPRAALLAAPPAVIEPRVVVMSEVMVRPSPCPRHLAR